VERQLIVKEQKLLETKLFRESVNTLQVNLGSVCNQSCIHCHQAAGPARSEAMSLETAERIIDYFGKNEIEVLELTGGAPEMNPNFRFLVDKACRLGRHVVVRSNLTVMLEEGLEDMPYFMADRKVELVASLPCYLESNVDTQRGVGVYQKSIKVLKILNGLGYGDVCSGLTLNLAYNPGGAFLPGEQSQLEKAYRQNLFDMHGIVFNQLYTLTNMPLGRFKKTLRENGGFDCYLRELEESANMDLLNNAMCRNLISVGWDGRVYDCDFNLSLDLMLGDKDERLWRRKLDEIIDTEIALADHCFGCIAGYGSSCNGKLFADVAG
jgi:radical SAM/Cys-rich protein